LLLPILASLASTASLPAQDYRRAEQFLTWNALRQVYHDQVAPSWYRDSTRFWYRVHTRSGFQFMTVNPAMRIPQMDISRVGIYGHSGGGFASTGALLQYPDFYRVAVSTAGNHDNRTYYHGWGERFQGLLVRDTAAGTDNYAAAANKTYASQLKGKLFLMHGDLDDNVHPAHTIALVDALVKANKSFDLLIVPDADHSMTQHPYVIRRTWDYFVEHLLGGKPPDDNAITPPPP
jgi:predicted esterase